MGLNSLLMRQVVVFEDYLQVESERQTSNAPFLSFKIPGFMSSTCLEVRSIVLQLI